MSQKNNSLIIIRILNWLKQNKKDVFYWYFIGFLFLFYSSFILYILVEFLKLKIFIATLVCAEIALVSRFFINHYLIFNQKNIKKSFIKFHIASLGGFFIWWAIANILNHFGVHYILASIFAVGASTLINFISNFFWVWKKK